MAGESSQLSIESVTSLDKMQSAIQLAAFHYIACMKACPTNQDHRVNIDKTEYIFASIASVDNSVFHAEFQRWTTKCVLRDLVENFSIFLSEVYERAFLASLTYSFSVTSAEFERLGVESQLKAISLHFTIDEAWIIRLIGYNRARNCLAHRQGIVGTRDVTDGNELIVRWLSSSVELRDGPPEPKVVIEGEMSALLYGTHVQGNSTVRARVEEREKRIATGSALFFSPSDVLEICQTFQLAAAAFSVLPSPK